MPLGLICLVHHDGEPRRETPYLKKKNCNNGNSNCLEVNSIVFPQHIQWDLTYIENPECLHRDVFPLQHHSPNTRVWHLYFTWFLWIRKKVCSMLSAGPKCWQTLWQYLYQRVISTANLSLCLTLVPSPRFNSVGQFILHTCASLLWHCCCLLKGFCIFLCSIWCRLFSVFFLLKTTSSVFPWLTQGLSIWRRIEQNHPSSFSKWIIQSSWNLSEEALVQDCTCLSLS